MATKKKKLGVDDPRADRVAKAVDKLRADYEIAVRIEKECDAPDGYGKNLLQEAVDKLLAEGVEIDINKATKLRSIADPVNGYSKVEINEFCSLAQKHGYAISYSVVSVFCSIPKSDPRRQSLQQRAIENRWSVAQLREAKAQLFGKESKGGKSPAVPVDFGDAALNIRRRCDEWCRWASALEKSKPLRRKDEIRKLLLQSVKIAESLHNASASKLRRIKADE